MPQPVFRFAPSPNGHLHLGHALSALTNFAMARAAGGKFLLRIEDIDGTRCKPEFEQAICEDLAWLGISWDAPPRRQSEHLADYAAALRRLEANGLIYPSFESRGEIAALLAAREAQGNVHGETHNKPWPRDPDGAPLYPGTAKAFPPEERARRIAAGEPYALRLDTAAAVVRAGRLFAGPLSWTETDSSSGSPREIPAQAGQWGDVVLARKETPTSYHLAVVVDDALQGITHVVRGQDLFAATAVHRLLQALLDLPAPVYTHHRLVLGDDGRKLAKSSGAVPLRTLRAQGVTSSDIRKQLGFA